MTTNGRPAWDGEPTPRLLQLTAELYQLLALGFQDPTRELTEALADGSLASDAVAIVGEFVEELKIDGLRVEGLLESAARLKALTTGGDVESVYHALATEYTRLFIGPRVPVVSPYETIHVDSDPEVQSLLFVGPSARSVLAAYRHAGIDMLEGVNEPPDHIATELEFAYYLSMQEATAREAQDEAELTRWHAARKSFELDHVCSWGVEFACQVEKLADVPFYSALAALAAAFFLLEKELD